MLQFFKKKIFLLICFVAFSSIISGVNYKNLVATYVDGTWNSWLPEITSLEKCNLKDSESKLILINIYYGYIGHLIDGNKSDEVLTYIRKAEVLINEILKEDPSNVTAITYKGAFLGFLGSVNPIKYFSSVMEGLTLINKAYDMNPNNLMAVINKASALYFLPSIFGGSKIEAAKLFTRARVMLETLHKTTDNCMYYYVMIFIGRSYEESGRFNEAKKAYERVLILQPEFKWVKEDMLPTVLVSLKKNDELLKEK